eukprot:jgi/Bigna1/68081/fgenesh1_pg.5_\
MRLSEAHLTTPGRRLTFPSIRLSLRRDNEAVGVRGQNRRAGFRPSKTKRDFSSSSGRGRGRGTSSSRVEDEVEILPEKVPKTFIFRRGSSSKRLQQLALFPQKLGGKELVYVVSILIRTVERRANRLRDFLAISTPLGVTHFMVLTESASGGSLRIIKTPKGPTFTFKLLNYHLIKEVISNQQRRPGWKVALTLPAIFVCRRLNASLAHHKLTSALLQGLFVSVDTSTLTTRQMKRLVTMHYNESSDAFQIRHYLAKVYSLEEGGGLQSGNETVVVDEKFFLDEKRVDSLVIGEGVGRDGGSIYLMATPSA